MRTASPTRPAASPATSSPPSAAALALVAAVSMVVGAVAGVAATVAIRPSAAPDAVVDAELVEDPRDVNGVAHARVRAVGADVDVATVRTVGATAAGDRMAVAVDGGEIVGPAPPPLGFWLPMGAWFGAIALVAVLMPAELHRPRGLFAGAAQRRLDRRHTRR